MPLDLGLATYIGTGVQSLTSGLGGLFTNGAIRRENQKNRDWNEKMWNLTNEYNSPEHQRELYERAGLNAALLYQNGTSALSSYAGNLGTSENFKNPTENFRDPLLASVQTSMQKQQLDSNLQVNESIVNKNNADAQEALSRIPQIEQQTEYLKEITKGANNQNIFFDLSKDIQLNILKANEAYTNQNTSYLIDLTKKVIKETQNIDFAQQLQTRMADAAIEQAWKKIDIMNNQVQGQLLLWLKEGDAAIRNSKANMLNAVTRSNEFNLDKLRFDTFTPAQLSLLESNLNGSNLKNLLTGKVVEWYDANQQSNISKNAASQNLLEKQSQYMQKQLDYYEINMFLDLTKSLLNVGF